MTSAITGYNIDNNNSTYKVRAGNTETVVSDKEVPWPAEVSNNDLPKFQGGTVKSVSHDNKSNIWIIAIANTTELEFNNYKTYLMNANWKPKDEQNVLVSMAIMTKADKQVTVIFDKSSKGVLITLSTIQK